MINKKSTFYLGIFIFLIPFMGFPSFWKSTFVVLSGLALVLMSVKISLPKKNSKGRIKREKVTPVFVENIPIYPRENANPVSTKQPDKTESSVE